MSFLSRRRAIGTAALVAALSVVGLSACGPTTPEPPRDELRGDVDYRPVALSEAAATRDVVEATMDLGNDLLADAEGENRVVSAASVALVFAVVAEGAGGPAAEALDEFLGAAGTDRRDAFSALQAAVADYDGDPSVVQDDELPERPLLHLATGIVEAEGHEIEPDFLDTIAAYFDAGVATADFADANAKAVLDAWVREHTGGLIEESAIESDADTVFVLQNAVLLAARWQSPFKESETTDEPFSVSSGGRHQVETMHQDLRAAYTEEPGGQAIRLPYTEGFAMDVLLPEEGTTPEELTTRDWAAYDAALRGEPAAQVSLALPKVDIDSSASLMESLARRGLEPVLAGDDLGGIAPGVSIDEVAQQALLRIDEEGTVAAAVTEVAGAMSAPVPLDEVEMIVDRPFALRIVHVDTGWPLFQAVVNDPRG